jgi:hypothetical protein
MKAQCEWTGKTADAAVRFWALSTATNASLIRNERACLTARLARPESRNATAIRARAPSRRRVRPSSRVWPRPSRLAVAASTDATAVNVQASEQRVSIFRP